VRTCRDRISGAIYSSATFDQLVIGFGSHLLSQNCHKIPAGENGAACWADPFADTRSAQLQIAQTSNSAE
jgi:hypothetical protein